MRHIRQILRARLDNDLAHRPGLARELLDKLTSTLQNLLIVLRIDRRPCDPFTGKIKTWQCGMRQNLWGANFSHANLARARLLFLPRYSPDLNPIEKVFAKLKHFVRMAAARTLDDVCAAIGKLLDDYSPKEYENYLLNAGYGRS